MLPGLIVTGASGFLGRHLLDVLKEEYRIFGLARRSQAQCGAPVHPNIRWFQVDIARGDLVRSAFQEIQRAGGADSVLHLAAHYDFTGVHHPEYWRTNVDGLRQVLDASAGLGIRTFIFSSSVAACPYPSPGGVIDEDTPPDGDHIYAVTKKRGEEMLREYPFDATIVRLAALFSDWCEYPPLFTFLGTWLSGRWNARMLGGRGESAIPYLHVRDALSFFRALLARERPSPRRILVASPDGAVSHSELFETATLQVFGQAVRPLHVPRPLCAPGIVVRDVWGRLTGERPFERLWMARHVDRKLAIDSSRTRAVMGWEPRPWLGILRRLPFLLQNLKNEPMEWHRRNRAAMKEIEVTPCFRIHRLLERHGPEIEGAFRRRLASPAEREQWGIRHPDLWDRSWNESFLLHLVMTAVRTRDLSDFMAYCRDLARDRAERGCGAEEVGSVLQLLHDTATNTIMEDPDSEGLLREVHGCLTTTLHFGRDQVADTFDELKAPSSAPRAGAPTTPAGP